MSEEEVNKKKLPRDANHLLSIEDQLKKIEAIIREIRLEMRAAGMESVELATGTIFHYLTLAEGLAEKYRGEFSTQRTTHKAKEFREQRKANIEATKKGRAQR